MINEGIKKIIEENALALATSNKEGKPHVIAIGDVKIISDSQLLVGDNYMKKTIENIKNNPNVCLVVWDKEEGYSLEGIASYYNSGNYLEQIKKIHKGYPAKGAIVIKLNSIKKLKG